jgi:Transposase DDE domain
VVAGGRRLQPRAGEKGGSEKGPEPGVDRARAGSKHHLLVDATGIPLAWTLTGGNRNDVTQLIPLLERIPPVRGRVGRPRRRPERITADRGYDHDKYGLELVATGSHRRSPAARPTTAPASAALAGLSSAPSPGCTTSSGCLFATTAGPKSTKPSSRSAAASSASGGSDGHSDRFLSAGSHSPEVDIVDADAGGCPVAGRRG